LAADSGTLAFGAAGIADFAEHDGVTEFNYQRWSSSNTTQHSQEWLCYIPFMVRTHLFFKVEIEHEEDEDPQRMGEEIGRHLRKLYVVRSVELSSVVTQPE